MYIVSNGIFVVTNLKLLQRQTPSIYVCCTVLVIPSNVNSKKKMFKCSNQNKDWLCVQYFVYTYLFLKNICFCTHTVNWKKNLFSKNLLTVCPAVLS